MFDEVIQQMIAEEASGFFEIAQCLDEQQLEVTIYACFCDHHSIQILVGNLFLLPRIFEQITEERRLTLLPFLIRQLLRQLPLVRALGLPLDSEPFVELFTERKIQTRIARYYSESAYGDIFGHFMTTLLAQIGLKIFAEYIEKKGITLEPIDKECFEAVELVCDCFFSTVDLLSLKPSSSVIFHVFHDVLHAAEYYDDRTPIPGYLHQIKHGLTSLFRYEPIRHWLSDYYLSTLQRTQLNFEMIRALITTCTPGEGRPFIHVWLTDRTLILNLVKITLESNHLSYMVELMRKEATKKLRYSLSQLFSLAAGLLPAQSTEAKDVFFQFIIALCEHYVDKEDFSKIIAAFCIKLFLENDGVGLEHHKDALVKAITRFNDFNLAMAFCIALYARQLELRNADTKIYKKKWYQHLGGDDNVNIASNWYNLYANQWSAFDPVYNLFKCIELPFLDSYSAHLTAASRSKFEALSALCQAIVKLRKQHALLVAQKEEDNTFVLDRMEHCSSRLIHVISGNGELECALRTVQSLISAADVRLLLTLISHSLPMRPIFNQLVSDDTNYLQDNYFDVLSAQLSRKKMKGNKKLVHLLLTWVGDDDGKAIGASELIMVLLILVTKSSGSASPMDIPELEKWRSFVFSLITGIAMAKVSLLRKVMLEVVQACNVHSFLPLKYRTELFNALSDGQALAIEPGQLHQLLSLFEEKVVKNKKKKNKPGDREGTQTTTDMALLETIGGRITVMSHCFDDDSAFSDDFFSIDGEPRSRDTVTPIVVRDMALESVLIVNPPVVKTQFNLLCDFLYAIAKTMDKKLNVMETITELPISWLSKVSQVKDNMMRLKSILNINLEQLSEISSIPLLPYNVLSSSDKIALEQEWNRTLASFCANVEREVANYMTVSSLPDAFESTINDVLLVLNTAYFKNIGLYINDGELIECLSLLSQYFEKNNYRVCIKGSSFAYPKQAHDLDILLIPEVQKSIPTLKGLSKALKREVFSGVITQIDAVVFQKITIQRVDGREIDIDLNIQLHPLSDQEEQNYTARALLTTCAVHWYVDGHAVMLPKTAQGVCHKNPTLGLLKELTIDDYPFVSGYILKNIIKYGDQVRYDPQMKQFIQTYLNPATRNMSVEINQLILRNALQYVFDRFESRVNKTIAYVSMNQLLQAIYPLDESTWNLCTTYFSAHFMQAKDHGFASTVSSPAFLVMYFLGGFIDQPEEKRVQFIATLEQFIDQGLTQLNIALAILVKLPTQTNGLFQHKLMYEEAKALFDLSHQNHASFKSKTVLQILDLWHPMDIKQRQKQGSVPQKIAVSARVEATVAPFVYAGGAKNPVFFKAEDLEAEDLVGDIVAERVTAQKPI
jgi:hypothetical protein